VETKSNLRREGKMKIWKFTLLAALFLIGTIPTGAGAQITYTFNNFNEELIWEWATAVYTVETPFEITNNTGFTWKDFHMRLTADGVVGAGGYAFMRFTELNSDGMIYDGAGTASFKDLNLDAFGYNEAMTVEGLDIPNGGVYSFTVDIVGGVAPEGLTKFYVYAQPSESTQPPPGQVPEPATMLLIGSGLLGLYGLKRKY